MDFFREVNDYLSAHRNVFASILYTALATIVVLFLIALVHALKGTKYRFVILMAGATVVDVMSYAIYSYFQIYWPENEGKQLCHLWEFLAFAIFQVQHWILAFTYYQCAKELPFVFRHEDFPGGWKLRSRVIYWSVNVFCVLSSFWPFFEQGPLYAYVTLYMVNVLCMLISSAFMIVALVKMWGFLTKQGLGHRLSPIRMVVHALAFLLYVLMFFLLTIIGRLFDPDFDHFFYLHWFICIFFGLFSYVCLFVVLWHLGSKSPKLEFVRESFLDDESQAPPSSQIQEDSYLLYAGCKLRPDNSLLLPESAMLSGDSQLVDQGLDTRLWS